MRDPEHFERRLEAAVRRWVADAPTEVDAAKLTRSLASGMPRDRRISPVWLWRPPRPRFAWAVGLVLVASLSVVVAGSGTLRNLLVLTGAPSASPVATRPLPPSMAPSRSPSGSVPSASPVSSVPASASAPAPSASAAAIPPSATFTQSPAAALSWTGFSRLPRLHPGQALTGPIIGDVAAGGPGFVAVGSDWVDAEGAVAVAWTSSDGMSWEEHQVGNPGPTTTLSSPALSSIVSLEGHFVAAGRVGIWRSGDGTNWEESAAPHDLNGTPLHLATGPAGLVAVGRSLDGPCQGRAWVSLDGITWEPVALPDPSAFCPTNVAGAASGYLATGYDARSPSGPPALLLSSDGVTWEVVPDQVAFEGLGYPEGALWTADRWTAFGRFQPATATEFGVQVWQSADGLTWRATDFLVPSGPFACESVHMIDATAFGAGFVAVGACMVQPEQVGIAWTSATGATWEGVLGRVRPMSAVAASATRVVVVGSEWPDHQPITCAAMESR